MWSLVDNLKKSTHTQNSKKKKKQKQKQNC